MKKVPGAVEIRFGDGIPVSAMFSVVLGEGVGAVVDETREMEDEEKLCSGEMLF